MMNGRTFTRQELGTLSAGVSVSHGGDGGVQESRSLGG